MGGSMLKKKQWVGKFTPLIVLISLTVSCGGGGGGRHPRSSGKITSEAGLNIPSWGVAIDAVYDRRLDQLIPGYKLINVVLTNRSASTIFLHPAHDRWTIKDNLGVRHKAINHLRFQDEKLWASLPPELRQKLDYPTGVRVGKSTRIDLFFPKTVDLTNFREIEWRSSHFKKEFNIYTTSGDKPDPKEFDVRKRKTPAENQARLKYEGSEDRSPDEEDKKNAPPAGKPFNPELDDYTLSNDS